MKIKLLENRKTIEYVDGIAEINANDVHWQLMEVEAERMLGNRESMWIEYKYTKDDALVTYEQLLRYRKKNVYYDEISTEIFKIPGQWQFQLFIRQYSTVSPDTYTQEASNVGTFTVEEGLPLRGATPVTNGTIAAMYEEARKILERQAGQLSNVALFLNNPNGEISVTGLANATFIEWGDGEEISVDPTISVYTHTYENAGNVILKIYGITDILENAFKDNEFIQHARIGSGVQSIGESAFENCTNLTTVDIENGVLSIYRNAFKATALNEIVIPQTVETLEDAFAETNISLIELKQPDPKKITIADNLFANVKDECIVVVPYGSLEAYELQYPTYYPAAIEENIAIAAMAMPMGAEEIIEDVPGLTLYITTTASRKSIQIKAVGATKVDWGDGTIETIADGETYLSHTYTAAANYVIVVYNCVELLGYCIDNSEIVYRLEIGASVVAPIPRLANNKFTNLREVIIADSVTELLRGAFHSATKLERVFTGNGLLKIETQAFGANETVYTPLVIVLGENVQLIEGSAFNYIENITIYSLAETPPTLAGGALYASQTSAVYVKKESLEAYQNAIGWKNLNLIAWGGEILNKPVVQISATGVASWLSANATSYMYRINGGVSIPTTATSIQLVAGDSIQVRAVGDNINFIGSDYSDLMYYAIERTQLPTPNVQISKSGMAEWIVGNAIYYLYTIDDGEEIETTATKVQLTDGQTIAVKAIGDNVNYTDSDYSLPVTYIEREIEPTTLNVPEVSISPSGMASWLVANSTGYIYRINGGEEIFTEALKIQLYDGDSIIVKAIGDGINFFDSEYSEEKIYVVPVVPTQLNAPVVQISASGMAKWLAVNAIGYVYRINGGKEITTDATSVQLNNLDTIEVRALGDNFNYFDSTYSVPKTYYKTQDVVIIPKRFTRYAIWNDILNYAGGGGGGTNNEVTREEFNALQENVAGVGLIASNASGTANIANENALEAKYQANNAKTTAEVANANANEAKANVETAKTMATEAKANAESAKTSAETANANANTAKAEAKAALTASSNASNLAATSNTNATEAKTVANEAKTTATNASNQASANATEIANIKSVNTEQGTAIANLQTSKQDKLSFDGTYNANTNKVATQDSIPKSLSQLNNDTGFITALVANLANYYTKSETLTATEINAKISAIPKFAIEVVTALPTSNISATTIYLVKSGTETQNLYIEYIYANNAWEKLGEQKLDLTGYATETWVKTYLGDYITATQFADIVSRVQTLESKVNTLEQDNTKNKTDIASLQNTVQTQGTTLDGVSAKATANETAIGNANAEIGTIKQDLANVNGTASAANTLAGNAYALAENAQAEAEAASQAAASANALAETANNAANNANDKCNTLQGQIASVNENLSNVSSVASDAQTKANAAQETANTALGKTSAFDTMANVDPTVFVVEGGTVSFNYLPNTTLIVWGDGTMDEYDPSTLTKDSIVTHTYAKTGIYTVKIYGGTLIRGYFAMAFSNSMPTVYSPKWLLEAKIGDTVITMEANAFGSCSTLYRFEFGNGVTVLNDGLFQGCSKLTEVTVPSCVTKIYGFGSGGNLKQVYFNNPTPPSVDFANCAGNPFSGGYAIVPKEFLTTYKNTWYISYLAYFTRATS